MLRGLSPVMYPGPKSRICVTIVHPAPNQESEKEIAATLILLEHPPITEYTEPTIQIPTTISCRMCRFTACLYGTATDDTDSAIQTP